MKSSLCIVAAVVLFHIADAENASTAVPAHGDEALRQQSQTGNAFELRGSSSTNSSEDDAAVGTFAGKCTSRDSRIIDQKGPGNAAGSMSKIVADCSSSAWSFWWGFDTKWASNCVRRKTGMSSRCADCYGKAGNYGYSNCKVACLFSWCGNGCLDCVKPYESTLTSCLGRPSPKADRC